MSFHEFATHGAATAGIYGSLEFLKIMLAGRGSLDPMRDG